ncbi:hypothetical protein ACTFIV_005269 [Dictyostelium citrinum]
MNIKIFIFTFIILFFVSATCLTPKPIIKVKFNCDNTTFGTGINKEILVIYVSATNYNKFSYEPPVVLSRTFSNSNENITINGRNFGDTLSSIEVHLNGIDISSTIHLWSDNEFTFKNLEPFENGLLNVTVDGNNIETPFYLKLTPVIYVLGCGGFITIFGKKLLANEGEFRVKVIVNDQETIVIESDDKIKKQNHLIVVLLS